MCFSEDQAIFYNWGVFYARGVISKINNFSNDLGGAFLVEGVRFFKIWGFLKINLKITFNKIAYTFRFSQPYFYILVVALFKIRAPIFKDYDFLSKGAF